ncbi:MAG: FecR domain-containing protein [Myxococcales bacterium]|nr:FecR domain-containing protein [Myxococcales bacterium]
MDVSWTPERAERIRTAIAQRHVAATRRRNALRMGGIAALFLAALWLPRSGSLRPWRKDASGSLAQTAGIPPDSHATGGAPSSPVPQPPLATNTAAAEAAQQSSLHLADGSSARPRGPSAVAVRQESASRVLVELLRGGADFSVTPSTARQFRVAAGGVTVESSGSSFSVDKQPVGAADKTGLRVTVAVREGRVRVFWAGQQAVLVAGERVEFQVSERSLEFTLGPAKVAPAASALPSSSPSEARTDQGAIDRAASPRPRQLSARATSGASAPASWRQLARSGKFEQAYQQAFAPAHVSFLPSPSPNAAEVHLSPLVDENPAPADLLLLADVARMSHHPASAVAPLRRLLERHSEDPRAPLAAFTLGRVLLDDMGQARKAAESFRRTQTLDEEGPLSHDALAREVEAWARAGDLSQARERAREYLRRYPSGRRAGTVRRMADLSAAPPAESTATASSPTE